MKARLTFVILAVVSSTSMASVISFSQVRSLSGGANTPVMAIDSVTNEATLVTEFYNGRYFFQRVDVYPTASDFISGVNAVTRWTGNSNPIKGESIITRNGLLYSRNDLTTSSASIWNQAPFPGALVSTIAGYNGMGGVNFDDTFDIGGGKGVSFMQDGTGAYVVGGVDGSADWQIEHLGSNLSSTKTVVFSPSGDGHPGYGFIIKGKLFLSDDWDSMELVSAIDVHTGDVGAVNHVLDGSFSPAGDKNFSYDATEDTLYLIAGASVYQAQNASVQLGLAVPEPSSATLLGLGGIMLGVWRRKNRGKSINTPSI